MQIYAISLGRSQWVQYRGKPVATGIYKSPVAGPVTVTAEGLSGDEQIDRKHHGGRDKAVYAYTLENHRHWAALRGVPEFPPGHFGENLTVTGMPDETVFIGDVFRMGGCLFQVTQPRVPCFKLGLKFGDPGFVAEFMRSGRTGFYLRVLASGEVCAGDAVSLEEQAPLQVSVRDAMRALQSGPDRREWIERVLAVPALSAAWREDLTQRLKSGPQPGVFQ